MATKPMVIISLCLRSSIFHIFFTVCTNPISLEFYCGSTCRGDSFFGCLGESMCFHIQFCCQRAPAQNFYQVFAGTKACSSQHFKINLGELLRISKFLECLQVDSFVLNPVQGFESKFRYTTL